MSSEVDRRKLTFIVSDGPKLSDDPTVRQTIRKQAMQGVAIARRKRKPDRKGHGSVANNKEDPDGQFEGLIRYTNAEDWYVFRCLIAYCCLHQQGSHR